MEIKRLLNEVGNASNETDLGTEVDNKEGIRILINSDSAFKGRISRPVVVSFKFKDLSEALSDASGLAINRAKAKAMFDAFRQVMGL